MLLRFEVDDTLTFKFSLHINYYRTTNYYRPFIDPQTYVVKSPFPRSNKGVPNLQKFGVKNWIAWQVKIKTYFFVSKLSFSSVNEDQSLNDLQNSQLLVRTKPSSAMGKRKYSYGASFPYQFPEWRPCKCFTPEEKPERNSVASILFSKLFSGFYFFFSHEIILLKLKKDFHVRNGGQVV